jgi:hypothetical protein
MTAFQFLNAIHKSAGFHGRGISLSQGLYLYTEQHKHRITAHRHPSFKWDSNPRPHSKLILLYILDFFLPFLIPLSPFSSSLQFFSSFSSPPFLSDSLTIFFCSYRFPSMPILFSLPVHSSYPLQLLSFNVTGPSECGWKDDEYSRIYLGQRELASEPSFQVALWNRGGSSRRCSYTTNSTRVFSLRSK